MYNHESDIMYRIHSEGGVEWVKDSVVSKKVRKKGK